MQLPIQMWDNSAGVRIPQALLEQIGAQIGQTLEAVIECNALVLRPAKPRYHLAELLAQCNPDAPVPDLGAWNDSHPVGQEVW